MSGGYYSTAEAARIARIPRSTVYYWARTGVIEPSQRKARPALYSFADLRDLRVAHTLRDQGAKRGEIKAVIDWLRGHTATDVARLHRIDAETVGGRILVRPVDASTPPHQPSKGGHGVFAVEMRDIFRDLGRGDDESVTEIHPAPRVTIDPEIRGGTPVVTGTRIPTALIAEMLAEGATVDEIVTMYPRLSAADVSAADEWEKSLRSGHDDIAAAG